MEIKQIYDLMNTVTSEVLGETNLVKEDLSNIVDIGTSVFDSSSVDKYVKSLVDHVGKVVFVNRAYRGTVPSVLMDSWEFGCVLEKITAEMPDAQENETWELEDGQSYDPNIFYKPTVSAKFFNKRVTFEVPISFTERQVKGSFSNVGQLNGFISMIFNAVEKSMTVKTGSLIKRTINNMIGETMYDFNSSGTYTGTGIRAVNLLKMYNDSLAAGATPLTTTTCRYNADYRRFCAMTIMLWKERMSEISSLFNIGGKDRFTTEDVLHCVLLADFVAETDVYLQSSTYHNELTKLPNHETVPYWQASGTSYAYSDVSKVYVKTASGHDVEISGVVGVMFDRDALGVTHMDKRVTSNFNPKAEFYSNWFKWDAGYFNDTNENFVVFYEYAA